MKIGTYSSPKFGIVTVRTATYDGPGGPLAVMLYAGEKLLAKLSVNIDPNSKNLPPGCFYARTWADGETAAADAMRSGLFRERTDLPAAVTGYVKAPVWEVVPAASASGLPPRDKATQDQLAAVLLQHGTEAQQLAALRYAAGRQQGPNSLITRLNDQVACSALPHMPDSVLSLLKEATEALSALALTPVPDSPSESAMWRWLRDKGEDVLGNRYMLVRIEPGALPEAVDGYDTTIARAMEMDAMPEASQKAMLARMNWKDQKGDM